MTCASKYCNIWTMQKIKGSVSLIDQRARKYRSVIMLLAILLVIAPAVLASCDSGTNEYAEAEAEVASELDALKSGSGEVPVTADFSEDVTEAMLKAYAEKLRDFDYVIAGSGKSEDGSSVIVTVSITTCDFGSVYLETWNDRMQIEEDQRYDSQFYGDLFTRFASLSVKNYTGQASIVCTRDEKGKWTSDLKTNPELINAISGGMVAEMTELAEES